MSLAEALIGLLFFAVFIFVLYGILGDLERRIERLEKRAGIEEPDSPQPAREGE